MLVLTRKQQERIHIGDQITITVVRIQGNSVRIGIEAPRDVRVIRCEVAAKDAQAANALALVAAADQTPISPDVAGVAEAAAKRKGGGLAAAQSHRSRVGGKCRRSGGCPAAAEAFKHVVACEAGV